MVDMEEKRGKETKVRRKFDCEFKNDTVRLVELSNRSVKQVEPPRDGCNQRHTHTSVRDRFGYCKPR
jgi:transposase-like protein